MASSLIFGALIILARLVNHYTGTPMDSIFILFILATVVQNRFDKE